MPSTMPSGAFAEIINSFPSFFIDCDVVPLTLILLLLQISNNLVFFE